MSLNPQTLNTYWNNKGFSQKKKDDLTKNLEGDLIKWNSKNLSPWTREYLTLLKVFWRNHSGYALQNSIFAIYYGYYNYGNNVAKAIKNNQIRGFDSLKELLDGLPFDTPDLVVDFLKSSGPINKQHLEEVMNVTINYL